MKPIPVAIQRGRALRAMEREALDAALYSKDELMKAVHAFAAYGIGRDALVARIDDHDRAMTALAAARAAT